MLNKLKILFISDLHSNELYLKKILEKINNIKFDLIVLGGDIAINNKTTMKKFISKFVKFGKEVIIYGGSHEQREILKNVVDKISEKNDNLINATEEGFRVINFRGYDLIFIPGSNSISHGGNYKGGNIRLIDRKRTEKLEQKLVDIVVDERIAKSSGHIYFKDIVEEFKFKKQSNRRNTMVFSHVPFLCKTENGIDHAIFGVANESIDWPISKLKKKYRKEYENEGIKRIKITEGSIFLREDAEELIKAGLPIIIKERNVGLNFIKKFLKRYRLKKFICGHIHEAGPIAIDKKERILKANEYHKQSYINSGEAKKGYITLLTLDNDLIKHRFIRI